VEGEAEVAESEARGWSGSGRSQGAESEGENKSSGWMEGLVGVGKQCGNIDALLPPLSPPSIHPFYSLPPNPPPRPPHTTTTHSTL
jgi:hypothetical protein